MVRVARAGRLFLAGVVRAAGCSPACCSLIAVAAAGAGSEREFFARLDRAWVLLRKRYSTRIPGQVTGYAVAMPR